MNFRYLSIYLSIYIYLQLKFTPLVTLVQCYVSTELEVCMTFLPRETRRHGTDGQTEGVQRLMQPYRGPNNSDSSRSQAKRSDTAMTRHEEGGTTVTRRSRREVKKEMPLLPTSFHIYYQYRHIPGNGTNPHALQNRAVIKRRCFVGLAAISYTVKQER